MLAKILKSHFFCHPNLEKKVVVFFFTRLSSMKQKYIEIFFLLYTEIRAFKPAIADVWSLEGSRSKQRTLLICYDDLVIKEFTTDTSSSCGTIQTFAFIWTLTVDSNITLATATEWPLLPNENKDGCPLATWEGNR